MKIHYCDFIVYCYFVGLYIAFPSYNCSEPSTIVIEGLKCGADDLSTLCYSDFSYVLGHHYVGLLYEHRQCNWIEADNIEPAIKYYLSLLFT